MYDPSLTWMSIKTEHFRIHYHQGLEDTAFRLAKIAERVHNKLSREIGWKPSLRTDIIVVDNTDISNGFATPYPFNKIQIYAVRPMVNSVLNNYDDWLEMVLTHEYTHILNIDMISWLPAGTRVIPGRVCFPNACLPVFTLEGSAVYHESKNTAFGRNNSTYTDMVLRTEVLSGSFKPIDEASHFPRKWPRGNVPYLYGGLFISYLEKFYGEGSIEKFFWENSDNIIPYSDNIYPVPYFYNKDVKDVFNKSFPVLWKEWEKHIKSRYNAQIDDIRSKGVTEYYGISHPDSESLFPRFTKDGKFIYYINNSPFEESALTKYDIIVKKNQKICRVNDPNYISLSPDGPVFLADAEFHGTFSMFYDIHVYDNKYRKITKGLRASYIDIFPDGNNALLIKSSLLKYSLVVIDSRSKTIKTVIDSSPVQLANPRISPDGENAVLTIKDSRGYADLLLININNMSARRLTSDRFNDIDPTWHPDGKRIIFSSDRDGIYNLYEYRLDEKTIYRLTNLLGGAFSPDVSIDGKLIVFSSYEARGNRISLMNYPEKSQQVLKTEIITLDPGFFADKKEDFAQDRAGNIPEPYNPIYSIMPAVRAPILPYFQSEKIYGKTYEKLFGALAMGNDAMMMHGYYLEALAHTVQKRASVNAAYSCSMFYPDILLGYIDDTLFYGRDEFPWAGKNKNALQRDLRRFGFASLYFPFINFNFQQYTQLSYIYEKIYADRYIPGHEVLSYETTFPRLQWLYVFNNAKSYTYSIGRENGRSILLLADYYHTKIGADEKIFKGRGEYSEFLPGIFKNNILLSRLRGGFSRNNQDYLSQFNLGKFNLNGSDDPLEKSDWGLRGYPSGTEYGDNIAMGIIEYRFPLMQRDAGIKTVPVMFRDLWINLFYEYGNVWNEGPDMKDPGERKDFMKEFKSSAGIELYMKITLGYQMDIIAFIGYARGFNDPGEKQVYWGISTSYDAILQNMKKRTSYL